MFKIRFKNSGNPLYRKTLLDSVDSRQIWSKELSISDITDIIKKIEEIISLYDYKYDKKFVMEGRRNSLKRSIHEWLNNSNNNLYEDNIREALFNLWEFVNDEYDSNLDIVASELNIPLKKVIKMCDDYRKQGIISLQEKDVIIGMIEEIKKYIDERKIDNE